MSEVRARQNERGTWCVYVDDRMLSDHATHTAARIAAQQIVLAERERNAFIDEADYDDSLGEHMALLDDDAYAERYA